MAREGLGSASKTAMQVGGLWASTWSSTVVPLTSAARRIGRSSGDQQRCSMRVAHGGRHAKLVAVPCKRTCTLSSWATAIHGVRSWNASGGIMFCHFSTSRASPPTRGPRHRDAYAWSAQSAVSDPIPVELYHSSMGRRAPSLYCRDPY